MNFLDKCNGVDLQGAQLSPEAKEAVKAAFPEAMAQFHTYLQNIPDFWDGYSHNKMMSLGSRCSLWGVEGRLQGFDILGYHAIYGTPKDWVLDALRDCSKSDYWYEFEKQWD